MNIAQRFCQCTRHRGFTLDVESDIWVCSQCGLPREMYYISMRSAQRPGKPIKYAQGFGHTSQRRSVSPHD